jgi:hypothetical protein
MWEKLAWLEEAHAIVRHLAASRAKQAESSSTHQH